jgi:hypothetical protein
MRKNTYFDSESTPGNTQPPIEAGLGLERLAHRLMWARRSESDPFAARKVIHLRA